MITLKSAKLWGHWTDASRAPTDLYIDAAGNVIGAGGATGRLVKYTADGSVLYSSPVSGKSYYAGDLTLFGVQIGGAQYVVAAGYYFTDALLYRDGGSAFSMPSAPLGADDFSMVSDVDAFTVGAKTYLYTVSRKGADIEIWEANASGAWRVVGTVRGDGWEKAGSVPKIEIVNGTLYAISQEKNSITSFAINSDGTLRELKTVDPTSGLLVSRPSDLVSFEQNGVTYLCVSSNKSSTLSLVKLGANGSMKVVDQVNDRTDTFFDSVNIVRHFSVGGMSYIVAAGGEKGISIYTLLPNGLLHHVDSIADIQDLTLNGVSDIEVKVEGGVATLFVSSLGENGVSKLVFDLSAQGLIAKSADDKTLGTDKNDIITYTGDSGRIYAGDGDDILIGGSGRTHFYGGAGADTFYLNGVENYIYDFNFREDKIDISGWGVKSGDEIVVRSKSRGAVVEYGNKKLRIFTDDQTRISMKDWSYADLFASSRADVENTPTLIIDEGDDISDAPEIYPGIRLTVGAPGEASAVSGYTGNDILYGDDIDEKYNELAGQLVRMYQSAVGRPPDKSGFIYWMNRIQNGLAIKDVVKFFINSDEYRSRYGITNDHDYVVKLYENSLGREPDAGGLKYWENILKQNPDLRLEVFMFCANSEELRSKTIELSCDFSSINVQQSWSDNIYRLYKAIFGRDPDLGGIRFWTKYLLKGGDYNDVIQSFLNGPEYQSSYGGTDNVDFVRLIYVNVHGREPDQAGYNFWLNALNNGMSRRELVRYTVDSEEYINSSTPLLEAWSRQFAQDDVLNGKGGNDILVGGMFSDTFIFENGRGGTSKILGFEAWDKVELRNTDYANLQEVLDDVVSYDGGIKLSLGDQDILFSGLTIDDLGPENIVLA